MSICLIQQSLYIIQNVIPYRAVNTLHFHTECHTVKAVCLAPFVAKLRILFTLSLCHSDVKGS
jgi:hypothetical protein